MADMICPFDGTIVPPGAPECPSCQRDLETLEEELKIRALQEREKIIAFRTERKKQKKAQEQADRMSLALSTPWIEWLDEYVNSGAVPKPKKNHVVMKALAEFAEKRGLPHPRLPVKLRI